MADFNKKLKKWLKNEDDNSKNEKEMPEKIAESYIENIEEVADAKEKVEEEMKVLERKILSERENWIRRNKEKEEERISLEAQLELIEKRALADRQKREMELRLYEEEAVKELKCLEKQLASETEQWTKRLEDKEHELKDESNKKMLIEAQHKLEEERIRNEYRQEIETHRKELESQERQLLEQRATSLQRLKQSDEINIQLRTQLSLRIAQLKAEWDEREASVKKSSEELENKQKELAKVLESKTKSWAQQLRLKETEISSLKTAIDQKKMTLLREEEEIAKKLFAEKQKVCDRIELLRKSIIDENIKWEEILKIREEEYNQIKLKLMLEETQEKSDWEKRKAEIAGLVNKSKKKLEFLEQKIREEEDRFRIEVQKKEEAFETLKIQGTLQVQELENQLQNKLESQHSEKIKLENKISDMQKEIGQNKIYWDSQITLKDNEINEFKNNLQQSVEESRKEREANLKNLEYEKEKSVARVKELEDELLQEKVRWDKKVEEKDKQISDLEHLFREEQLKTEKKLEQLEKDFNKKNKPLFNQLESIRNEISLMQERSKIIVEEKENWASSFKLRSERQESARIARFEEQKNTLELDKKNLEQRSQQLLTQVKEGIGHYQNLIKEREIQIYQLRENVKSTQEKNEKIVEDLINDLKKRKKDFEIDISKQNVQLEEENKKFDELIVVKEKERHDLEDELNQKIKELQAKQQQMESVWEREKNDIEKHIAELENERIETAKEWQSKLYEKENQIRELTDQLSNGNLQYQKQIAAERTTYEQEIKPLEAEEKRLKEVLASQRGDWESRIKILEQKIHLAVSEKRAQEKICSKILSDLEKQVENEKDRLDVQLQNLIKEKAKLSKENQSFLSAKNNELNAKKEELEQKREEFKEDFEILVKEHKELLEELKRSNVKLTKDLEEAQKHWPEAVRKKQQNLTEIQNEISLIEEQGQREQIEYDRNIQSIQSAYSIKLTQEKQELELIRKESEEKAVYFDNELKKIEEDYQQSQQEIENKIEKERRLFSDHKSELEKAREELLIRVKDEETRGKTEVDKRENQIRDFKELFNKKRDDWDERSLKNRNYLDGERKKYIEEEQKLKDMIVQEEQSARKLLKQKEDDTHQLKLSCEDRLAQLRMALDERKRDWRSVIKQLQTDLTEQKDFWVKQKELWAGKIQEKEQILHSIKESFSQWETKKVESEERQREEFEKEITRLKEDINTLELKTEKQKNYALEQLSLKEKELENIQREYNEKENQLRQEHGDMEKSFVKEKEQLVAEIQSLDDKLKEVGETRNIKLKAIESEINRANLALNEKRTQIELELKKKDREFSKLKIQFEAKKRDMEKEVAAVTGRLNFQVQLKDEELNTIKMRINLRKERLISEWKRREESLTGIIDKLKSDLEHSSNLHQSARNELTKGYIVKERELALLKDELTVLNEQFEREREQYQENYEKFKIDNLSGTEKEQFRKELAVKNLEVENKLKQGELNELNNELLSLEKDMNYEQNKSKEILRLAFDKTEKLRKEFSKEFDSSVSKRLLVSPAKRNFENGIKSYQQGLYEEAIALFQRALDLNGDIVGIHQYIALAYLHLGDFNKAIQYGERALLHNPNDEVLCSWLDELKRRDK
ncbi:MAG: tetratricopeptide repeat protein [bacterium]